MTKTLTEIRAMAQRIFTQRGGYDEGELLPAYEDVLQNLLDDEKIASKETMIEAIRSDPENMTNLVYSPRLSKEDVWRMWDGDLSENVFFRGCCIFLPYWSTEEIAFFYEMETDPSLRAEWLHQIEMRGGLLELLGDVA